MLNGAFVCGLEQRVIGTSWVAFQMKKKIINKAYCESAPNLPFLLPRLLRSFCFFFFTKWCVGPCFSNLPCSYTMAAHDGMAVSLVAEVARMHATVPLFYVSQNGVLRVCRAVRDAAYCFHHHRRRRRVARWWIQRRANVLSAPGCIALAACHCNEHLLC